MKLVSREFQSPETLANRCPVVRKGPANSLVRFLTGLVPDRSCVWAEDKRYTAVTARWSMGNHVHSTPLQFEDET